MVSFFLVATDNIGLVSGFQDLQNIERAQIYLVTVSNKYKFFNVISKKKNPKIYVHLMEIFHKTRKTSLKIAQNPHA